MQSIDPYLEKALRFALTAAGVAVALGIGLWILQIARRQFAEQLARKSYSDMTVRASSLALLWVGWIFIALVLMRIAGVRIGIAPGALSGIALLLAVVMVAGWNVITSFVCGLILVSTQPFRVGDDLEILEPSGVQGAIGRVTEFTYFHTTLQQIDPTHGRPVDVDVPNSQFFTRAYRREKGTDTTPLRVGKSS